VKESTTDNRDTRGAHVAVRASRARGATVPQQQRLTDAQRLTICELANEGLSVREAACARFRKESSEHEQYG
jgi:hypothetical protein